MSATRSTCLDALAMMEEGEKSTIAATQEILEREKFKDVAKFPKICRTFQSDIAMSRH